MIDKENILLRDHSVVEFLDVVASDAPAPGGGSVSALIGAVGASLTQMVGGLTLGRKRYADIEGDIKELIEVVEKIRQELIIGIDKDSEAYAAVSEAFKMPRETDEEKATRSAAIQEATKIAADVPLEVAKVAAELFPHIEMVVKHGNNNAITDGCIAAMACRLAVRGALLNVRINLGSLKDEELVERYTEECVELEKYADEMEKVILEYTYPRL